VMSLPGEPIFIHGMLPRSGTNFLWDLLRSIQIVSLPVNRYRRTCSWSTRIRSWHSSPRCGARAIRFGVSFDPISARFSMAQADGTRHWPTWPTGTSGFGSRARGTSRMRFRTAGRLPHSSGDRVRDPALILPEASILDARYGRQVHYEELCRYLAWVCVRSGQGKRASRHFVAAVLSGAFANATRSAKVLGRERVARFFGTARAKRFPIGGERGRNGSGSCGRRPP